MIWYHINSLSSLSNLLLGAYEVVKRLEAQKAAEEKRAAAQRAREMAKKTQAQKETLDEQLDNDVSNQIIQKGKLDLSGQRKKFADPFAGPDTEHDPHALPVQRKQVATSIADPVPPGCTTHDENGSDSAMTTTSSPAKSPKSEGNAVEFFPATSPGAKESPPKNSTMRFFPATSPGNGSTQEKISSRTQRYNSKTSTSARTNETATKMAGGETDPDPRAALMAMLSKRNSTSDATSNEHEKTAQGVVTDGDGNGEEGAQPDPRAALMAMLSKRNLPSTDDKTVPEVKEEEKPIHEYRSTDEQIVTSPKKNDDESNTGCTDDEKKEVAQSDPRAALMAMLSKRSLAAQSGENDICANADKAESVPRDTLTVMPSVPHSPPTLAQNDIDFTGDSKDVKRKSEHANDKKDKSQNGSSSNEHPPVAAENDGKVDDAQPEPRAVLMAMLSKRNSLSTDNLDKATVIIDGKEAEVADENSGSSNQCDKQATDDSLHRGGVLDTSHEPTSILSIPDSLNMPSFDTSPPSEDSPPLRIEPASISDEKEEITPTNTVSPINIAAMAAAAAKKKEGSSISSTPPSVEKRKFKSKFSAAGSTAPMGIAGKLMCIVVSSFIR